MISDAVIVGGGLAGLVNAILLARNGLKVIVIEKKSYPFHKVCGEYISNEVLPFFKSIGFSPFSFGAVDVQRFRLTTLSGKSAETELPLGGFGISRFTLDQALFEKASQCGAEFIPGTTVFDIQFENNQFELTLSGNRKLKSLLVIGAFGKRSVLDRSLNRQFFHIKSPFIGIKYHTDWEMPSNLVELHLFGRGYCGLSKVEENRTNLCYMGLKEDLRRTGSVENLEKEVLSQNPFLREVLVKGKKLFEPLAINEISFAARPVVENHILMSGDAAGLVTPLNGNGMAMAIRSANMLSTLILRFFQKEISCSEMENMYAKAWQKAFAQRLWVGRQIQKVFFRSNLIESSVPILNTFPGLLQMIVKHTHGKPFDLYSAR